MAAFTFRGPSVTFLNLHARFRYTLVSFPPLSVFDLSMVGGDLSMVGGVEQDLYKPADLALGSEGGRLRQCKPADRREEVLLVLLVMDARSIKSCHLAVISTGWLVAKLCTENHKR